MKSLYHIQADYLALASALEVGELTPEIETALAINEQELQQKAIGYAYVIKESEANVDTIEAEIARLTGLKQAEKRKADALKSAISNAMQFYGVHEVKTPTVRLSFRKSEGLIGQADNLADEFVTLIPEQRKPNAAAIKTAIKEGREVEGYEIETRWNLQIK
jgi:hypothetical protein